MEHDGKNLTVTEAVRSVQLLKIDGYCATATMNSTEFIKPRSRWNIDGHEWEVHFYPDHCHFLEYEDDSLALPFYEYEEWTALKLILVSEPQREKLRVNLNCRLVSPSQHLLPSKEKSVSHVFDSVSKCSPEVLLMLKNELPRSGYIVNDSLTVECTITVLKELTDIVVPAANTQAPPLPPSDLHRHFGDLWQGQRGTDVTFVLESGERFLAHKLILAARSPVFMAEFMGDMNERSSQSVRIEGIEAAVFKVKLHFIYTDTAPELDEEPEWPWLSHLLVAADRYGLDRLKLICEGKLSGGISIDTVATTLALAEQHNCSLLKAKCVDFIAGSPETLDAILATEGYNHLVASCPMVLTELLRASIGRRN